MKIVIVGNCQARPVAEILSISNENVEITGTVIVHLAKNSDAIEHELLFKEADVILAQQVQSTYPVKHVATENIKERFPDKTVTWVNVFFQGQNPDLFYVTSIGGNRIVGPMDVYHSRALIELWKSGLTSSEVDEDSYISQTSEFTEIQTRVEKSLLDLQRRESTVDIKMHSFIQEHWQTVPLFHTFNHPNLFTLLELCDRMCAQLSLQSIDRGKYDFVDKLSLVIPPMEKTMANRLGISYQTSNEIHGLQVSESNDAVVHGKRKVYEFKNFVEVTFNCYLAQSDKLEDIRFTPA